MGRTNRMNRQSGEIRRTQILDAAYSILAHEGYPNFTLRKIAKASGIHFATLRYYFKTKDDLLAALIESKLRRDFDSIKDVLSKARNSPKARFNAVINLIIQANSDPEILGFFKEFWALGNSDDKAARFVDHYYEEYCHWISDLVRMVNPKLSKVRVTRRALQLIMLLEGIIPAYSREQRHRNDVRSMERELREAAWLIATVP